MSSNFRSSLPTNAETRRMTPIESSRRVLRAFEEAREELRRRGQRDTLAEASKLLGATVSTSSYQLAQNHIRAVDVYGINPSLAKQEAVRRLRLLEPVPLRVAAALDEAQEQRSEPEILADAVSNLVVRAGSELTRFDAEAISGFLRRDPAKRGATKSALIDLIRWLGLLEKAL